jgi:hypothetical protein
MTLFEKIKTLYPELQDTDLRLLDNQIATILSEATAAEAARQLSGLNTPLCRLPLMRQLPLMQSNRLCHDPRTTKVLRK